MCKFCGRRYPMEGAGICRSCAVILVCAGCGYDNREYLTLSKEPDFAWPGLPRGCYGCGPRKHVNTKVPAVGIKPVDFSEVSAGNSFIRKRISSS